MTMFENELNRALRRLSDSFFDTDDFLEASGGTPGNSSCWYGYTVTVGSDGRPVVREYGNTGRASAAQLPTDTIVDEKNNTIKFITEMPGVEKSDIKVSVDDDVVDISATRDKKKYHGRIPIKHKIDENSAKATYKNGILELVFGLLPEEPSGRTVKVE